MGDRYSRYHGAAAQKRPRFRDFTDLRFIVAMAFGIFVFLANGKAHPPEATTHCFQNETVWFNGRIVEDDRIISVCGTAEAHEDAWLQMRIGMPGSKAARYPAGQENTLAAFWFNNESHSSVVAYAFDYHGEGPRIILREKADAKRMTRSHASISFRHRHGAWKIFEIAPTSKFLALTKFESLIGQPPFE